MTDKTEAMDLAKTLGELSKAATQTEDDIRYYSGGSKYNEPLEQLKDRLVDLYRTGKLVVVPDDAVEVETFASINEWCDTTFGLATVPQIIARAKEEFNELEEPDADHAIEAADVVICLCRIPGFAEALQRKMAINRARKWRLVGNGTGYHIPDALTKGADHGNQ